MPVYLINADVGIIPFKKDPLSQSINPVKLYEYLAAGLPLASSYMEEIRQFKDVVFWPKQRKSSAIFWESVRKK